MANYETTKETKNKIVNFFSKYNKNTFKKNQIIISSNEAPSGIVYLKTGYVKQYTYSPDGQEIMLHIYTPGAYFPMTWAIAELPNRYFFKAITEVEAHVASKKEFSIFLKNEVDVLYELTYRLVHGISGLLERTEVSSYGNGNHKIISTLIYLSKHFGEKRGGETVLTENFTQAEIASFAGLARETTAYELKKLEDKGLISKNKRQLIIPNLMKLQVALESD